MAGAPKPEETFASSWLGLSELTASLDKLGGKAEEAGKAAISRAAAIVEATIKEQFQGAHAYGQPHTGGKAPNVVSGRLRTSVHTDPVVPLAGHTWGTFVGPRMVYGRRVELGFHGSRGYPYTRPGFLKAKPLIAAAQNEVIRSFLHL